MLASFTAAVLVLLMKGMNIEANPQLTYGTFDARWKPMIYQTFTSGDLAKVKIFNPSNPCVPIEKYLALEAIATTTIKLPFDKNADHGTHFAILTEKDLPAGQNNFKFEFSQEGTSSNVEFNLVNTPNLWQLKGIKKDPSPTTNTPWFLPEACKSNPNAAPTAPAPPGRRIGQRGDVCNPKWRPNGTAATECAPGLKCRSKSFPNGSFQYYCM